MKFKIGDTVVVTEEMNKDSDFYYPKGAILKIVDVSSLGDVYFTTPLNRGMRGIVLGEEIELCTKRRLFNEI